MLEVRQTTLGVLFWSSTKSVTTHSALPSPSPQVSDTHVFPSPPNIPQHYPSLHFAFLPPIIPFLLPSPILHPLLFTGTRFSAFGSIILFIDFCCCCCRFRVLLRFTNLSFDFVDLFEFQLAAESLHLSLECICVTSQFSPASGER